MEYISSHDLLTGLVNRRSIQKKFDEVIDSYNKKGKDFKVLANNEELTLNDGQYTIQNIQENINIVVNGIEQIKTYTFAIDLDEEDKYKYPDLLEYYIPSNFSFDIIDSEKLALYKSEDFIITSGKVMMSIKDIVDEINLHGVSPVVGFVIGESNFITIEGENISINWDALSQETEYTIIIKFA